MASDGEEEVVVVGRKFRKLILEQLGSGGSSLAFFRDHILSGFGEEFFRQFAKPGFEQGSNGIDIVKVWDIKETDI